FPELKSADLDSFDRKKRAQVDVFAREQIVEQNPQWLDEAFADVEMESVELFVAEGTEFRGLKNFAFLDQEETVGYSEDGENYFRILVMGCGDEELLPLAKAPSLGDGTALIEKRREQIDSRLTLEEAMQRRFAAYLESDEQSLFAPVTHDMTVSRVEPSFIAMDDLVEGKSPLLFDKVEGAYFYEFVDKRVDRVVPQKKIVQAQQLLASELKEKYIATLLGD
ncbi:MAG: hypothetical protein K0U13_02605, partial [Chlamydiae bacterium]|nr:hypothetical protein [Chlamydiota bacterium]